MPGRGLNIAVSWPIAVSLWFAHHYIAGAQPILVKIYFDEYHFILYIGRGWYIIYNYNYKYRFTYFRLVLSWYILAFGRWVVHVCRPWFDCIGLLYIFGRTCNMQNTVNTSTLYIHVHVCECTVYHNYSVYDAAIHWLITYLIMQQSL